MTLTPVTPGCCNSQDDGTVSFLAGCERMRCIKINMVYPPMHHFLNVSDFLCFFLAPLSSLFNLSHFQRTVQEAITGRPWSPPPAPSATAQAWGRGFAEWLAARACSLLPPGSGQNLNSLFLVGCFMLYVYSPEIVCVLVFVFGFFVK